MRELQVEAYDRTSRLGSEMVISYDADDTITNIITALIALQTRANPVTVGTIDGTIAAYTRQFNVTKQSILKTLLTLRDTTGGYLEVDNDYKLQWSATVGEDTGQQIRFKKNLMGITREVDYSKMVNRLYAYGSGAVVLAGVGYIDDLGAIATYGRYIGFLTNTDIDDVDTLTEWANLKLVELSVPVISYKINTADFSKLDTWIDWSFDKLQLGSVINIIDEELGARTNIIMGSAATNRAATYPHSVTYLCFGSGYVGRANYTGKITSVEIWANTNMTGCKVGSFRYTDSGKWVCRDYTTIGAVTSGSKQTFDVNFDVEYNDVLGIYFATGDIEADTAGGYSLVIKAGDQFDTTEWTLDDFYALDSVSCYATGLDVGIDVDVRVVKIEHKDMLNPSDMIIDFTNKLPDITDTLLGI